MPSKNHRSTPIHWLLWGYQIALRRSGKDRSVHSSNALMTSGTCTSFAAYWWTHAVKLRPDCSVQWYINNNRGFFVRTSKSLVILPGQLFWIRLHRTGHDIQTVKSKLVGERLNWWRHTCIFIALPRSITDFKRCRHWVGFHQKRKRCRYKSLILGSLAGWSLSKSTPIC